MCFKSVEVFQGNFNYVSKKVSRVFQGNFIGVSTKSQGCFMRVFLRYFKIISRVL